MKRRALLAGLAGAAAVNPRYLAAQAPARTSRVGFLSVSAAPRGNPAFEGVVRGLHERGYREDDNLTIAYRKADGDPTRLPALAAELAELRMDVIIAVGAEAVLRAVLGATSSIPIVMFAVDYDPLARGFIDSIARPGGRVTGVYFMQSRLMGKRIELLKAALPRLTRVAALHDRYTSNQVTPTREAADALGLALDAIRLDEPPYDFDRAMTDALATGAEALIVLSSPVFFGQRERAGAATVKHRLPAIFHFGYYAKAGGLMAYGVNLPEMFRYSAATHVARILEGADPADLPVEQPTQFELVVNLATARTLGLDLPPSILVQATEVIE